ncbi:MAG: plastocyanin/azurin family copper-binding protein [Thermoanaerobaculia bacterium]
MPVANMRKLFLSLAILLAASGIFAEDVTLPAAASIVGGAPFFSDVRAFNTSYGSALDVTARYRCFIPSPCSAVGVPQIQFSLAPRESRSFNDIVATTFQAPDTAGGVEFDHSGGDEQLVVTSRLYSTAPEPTVGMFIPGLRNNEAHARTVLTSIRNGGFRTNVGAYNREDDPVTVTFTIFDAGDQLGTPVSRSISGHSGAQVNNIFNAAGQGGHSTENAVIVVAAEHEIFSYASVIDNNTTDPIFVRGAEDREPAAGGPVHRTVQVGQNGSVFLDQTGGGTITRIHPGDTVTWVWGGSGQHGVASGECTGGGYYDEGGCDADGTFSSGTYQAPHEFTRTFTEAGSFQYFCPIHGAMMRGRVIVE